VNSVISVVKKLFSQISLNDPRVLLDLFGGASAILDPWWSTITRSEMPMTRCMLCSTKMTVCPISFTLRTKSPWPRSRGCSARPQAHPAGQAWGRRPGPGRFRAAAVRRRRYGWPANRLSPQFKKIQKFFCARPDSFLLPTLPGRMKHAKNEPGSGQRVHPHHDVFPDREICKKLNLLIGAVDAPGGDLKGLQTAERDSVE